jgi:poly(A) polymerase
VSIDIQRRLEVQLQRIRQAIPPDVSVHLVGGGVRDIILNRPLHDIDFVLVGDVLGLARKVANHLGAVYFTLDESRHTGRVLWTQEDGKRLVLDFAAQRGPDLESDLRARDFTINAMALPLEGEIRLLDPLGGVQDLHDKLLRPCSPDSLDADPVRILRAVRHSVALNLRMSPETRLQIKSALDQLRRVSPERVRDELMRMLEGPRPEAAMRSLDELEILPFVLPELAGMKGVRQSPPHQLDVWEHSLSVLRNLELILELLGMDYDADNAANQSMQLLVLRLGRYRPQLDQHFRQELTPERSLRGLLFLAAFFHDAGKPQAYHEDENGRIRFLRHEEIGARLAARRGHALPMSNEEVQYLVRVVRHHMRPHHMLQSGRKPSRRTIYRFFRDCKSAGVDISLLSLADCLATYQATLPVELWDRQLEVARLLLQAYWEQKDELVSPPALINGYDLISELSLAPGPQIGRVLEVIREAQAIGRVQTREQALALARSLAGEKFVGGQ